MKSYTHLSLEEREKIYALRVKGLSRRSIAKKLHRDVGTISRELRVRAKYGRAYLPCRAQKDADRKTQRQRYKAPLKCPLVFLYVREHLRVPYSWSPEQIMGRLPIEYPGYTIDDETIYRYIYGKKQRRMKLWRHLVLHRRKRMKKDGRKIQEYGRLKTAIPISNRPETVNKRVFPGHWETDNMEGKRSDKTAVSVTVERVARITRLKKLADHTAAEKATTLIAQLKKEPLSLRKSITCDRGAENSYHKKVTQATGAVVYACTAYHAWERGTVENTIGRVRRYFPKGESVEHITQKDLSAIEDILNNTPRKILGYLTPNEYWRKIQTASRTP